MALRFYLVPKIGAGTLPNDPFRPKYIAGGIAGQWEAIDYGKEAWMLVAADVTGAEHTAITANADVTAVPANLDSTVGGALATVQAKLEAANLAAQWVTSGMTWRTVLKWTIRMLFIQQRFRGFDAAADRLFANGRTLDSTVGDIPTAMRQRLVVAAASLDLNTTGLTLNTTIRVALVSLGQQMTATVLWPWFSPQEL